MLLGAKPEDIPDYESSVEELQPTPEEIEEALSASPFVRRVPAEPREGS